MASGNNLLNQENGETVNVSQESTQEPLITQPNTNTIPNGIQGLVDENNNLDNDSEQQDSDEEDLIGKDNNNEMANSN